MNNSSEPDCLFCRIFRTQKSQREWHDQILYERDGIAVLPGVGAQREGYLLIVPRVHAFSCAELSKQDLARLEDVKEEVAHVLNQVYGPCVFFEHGACAHERRAGGCIDHVHVHALPIEAPIVELANRERSFAPLDGDDGLEEWIHKPYVAIQDQAGGMFIADGEKAPGQFMRRVIDKAIGEPGEWDFEVYRHEDRVHATIDRLAALFEGIEEADPRYAQGWERSGPKAPLVYVARAVDNRSPDDVREAGEELRLKIRDAGFAAVDPVASPFPRTQVALEENKKISDFIRVQSDLAWLRRSDAVLIDMSLEKWSYVGCVCELVYAYLWGIPTIIVAGKSPIQERIWLRYHANDIVHDIDEAIEKLHKRFASAPASHRARLADGSDQNGSE